MADNSKAVIQRIVFRLSRFKPGSPEIQRFATKLGTELVFRIKQNITRKRIVDAGRLLNSVGFRVRNEGEVLSVLAGTVHIPYAAAHEFGVSYTPQMMRAMFASLRDRGLLGRPGKGILEGSGLYGRRLPARPYMRPALEDLKRDLPALVRSFFRD